MVALAAIASPAAQRAQKTVNIVARTAAAPLGRALTALNMMRSADAATKRVINRGDHDILPFIVGLLIIAVSFLIWYFSRQHVDTTGLPVPDPAQALQPPQQGVRYGNQYFGRDVSTQTAETYTGLRGVQNPRYKEHRGELVFQEQDRPVNSRHYRAKDVGTQGPVHHDGIRYHYRG